MLPSFKLLLAGALAAGIWVVSNEDGAPRPSAPVKSQKSRDTILPATALRPPRRPSAIVTGAVRREEATREYRTRTRVRLRRRAGAEAPVLLVLEAGRPVKELARSGQWRLVSAAGRKGWVDGRYLTPTLPSPRPKLPVPGAAAGAAAKARPIRKP